MTSVLLGTACGDALGVPFESKPDTNPLLLAWDQNSYLGSQYHGLEPGQYSDDTQMSLMVAESLVENKGFSPEDLAARYVDWIASNRARGYGRTTLIAVQALQAGKHWSESGVNGSYGNGTAMRAAPFGVFYRDDLYGLIEAVKIDSAITHKSEEAEAGALAIALAIYFIINKNETSMLDNIMFHLPESKVRSNLAATKQVFTIHHNPADWLAAIGTSADVRQTVPAALYCYLKFTNYRDAVLAAIKAGGDTDTTAAIVGALCGAKYGRDNIPKDWSERVEDRFHLINLDRQLLGDTNG